jgi:hypothetical protein
MGIVARMLVVLVWVALGSGSSHAGQNDFAIVIGNQTYRHGMPEVAFAKNDARAFAKAAIDVFGVPPANIIRVDDASLGDFFRIFGAPGGGRGQIDSLITHPEAKLFVYYSGHGMPAMRGGVSRPFLMPFDASAAATDATAYGLDDVIAAVARVMKAKAPRGRAMVVVDACFSGASDGGTLIPDTSAGAVPAKLAPVTDVIVLAAASEREVAHWDRERKKGVFTDALLFGLYGAASQKGSDGKADAPITLRDLDTYLKQRMSSRLRELNPGGLALQTPVLTGSPDAVIVRYQSTMPAYDAETRTGEESECRYLAEFGEAADIDGFLRRCTHCPCRAALETRRSKLADVPRACEGERPVWERIQKSGSMDQVRWMATTARCGIIRAAAEAYIKRHELERTKAEEEQLRREEAARKAAEEKKAREDAAERAARRAEDDKQRLRDEELKRQRELDRLADERRKIEEDRRRLEDEQRRIAEQRARDEALKREEEARRFTPATWCSENRRFSDDETAICQNRELSQLDEELTRVYFAVHRTLGPSAQITMRDAQRVWLKQRLACGFNTACLQPLYQARIRQIRGY